MVVSRHLVSNAQDRCRRKPMFTGLKAGDFQRGFLTRRRSKGFLHPQTEPIALRLTWCPEGLWDGDFGANRLRGLKTRGMDGESANFGFDGASAFAHFSP